VPDTIDVAIASQADVERARREIRQLALAVGFDRINAEQVTLAASELATNLLKYALEGRISATALTGLRAGLQIDSHDAGPGLPDIPSALREGYSTGGSLGGGLPGVLRLMDEVTVESSPTGTHIIGRKWLPQAS